MNVKLPAVSWTSGVATRLFLLRADINNRIYVDKSLTNNTLNYVLTFGATSRGVNVTTTTEDWFEIGLVWSKAGNFCRFFFNGVQQGADQVPGVWAGALASTLCTIAAGSTTPDNPTAGNFAHWLLLNQPATNAQVNQKYLINP